MRLQWPLIGRPEKMRIVQAALIDAESAGIIITGAAGVGKSRVAREALSAEEAKGRQTRWVGATSTARELPLGAFAPWTSSTAADTMQIVRGVVAALVPEPAGGPVIICVDDVHLLDDLSAFVVHQIVERNLAKVILTIRDGEPVPDSVQEIWRGGQFDRLEMAVLSRDETSRLVSTTLGGSLHPDVARRLWTLTGGNALYLRNIVEQEVTSGNLTEQRGYWRWLGELTVRPSLSSMIESTIGALPAPTSEVIDMVAVSEPIDLAILTSITSAEAVEDAESRSLIVLERSGVRSNVRLAHPLYGEVRRAGASSLRLARLRGRVASALAPLDNGTDMRMAVRRATLSLQFEVKADPNLFARAAQGALWLADLPLAERLADRAIHAGAGLEASLIRAHALGWLGRGQEADDVLGAVETSTLTTDDTARLTFMRASNTLWALSDPPGAKQLADDGIKGHPCVTAFLTVYWAVMGECSTAVATAEPLSMETLPQVIGVETALALTIAHGGLGRTSEAVAAAEAAYALVSQTFDAPHMRFVTADSHVTALILAGLNRDATEIATELQQLAADMPGAAALLSTAVAGRAALAAGNLDSACALLKPIVELLSMGETSHVAYRYQLPLGTALAIRGLPDQSAWWIAALDETQAAAWRYVGYERSLANAWLAASRGAKTEAIAAARSGAELARANTQFAAEVQCLQTAVQFGDRSCAERLRELAAIVEGPRVGLALRLATALAVGDGAELLATSEGFEGLGDLVAAMDAAAHAAIVYRARGKRGSALGCSARADQLARRTGASTPAFREGTDELPLTVREREIAMLIGAGLTNRDIAERLSLSYRTVENHIHRALSKTATRSREELAALLTPR